ncbi:hypothetical protein [Oceanibaculum nanhaiense]|uniref:hypothetical protein n=1 Tax=Oceanibaculum nanhaiense TaxID=1909734 RepID=UPI003D287DAE
MFLGLSAPNVLKPEMVAQHGRPPDHHGAGQPDTGDHAGRGRKAVRDDAIMATGRSDYPESGQQRPVLSPSFSAARWMSAPRRSTRK